MASALTKTAAVGSSRKLLVVYHVCEKQYCLLVSFIRFSQLWLQMKQKTEGKNCIAEITKQPPNLQMYFAFASVQGVAGYIKKFRRQ